MSQWCVCLVRQQGWIPDLICWFTESEWNHVCIQMADGNFLDLDRPGLRIIPREEYLSINEVIETNLTISHELAANRMNELMHFSYGDQDNVAYVLHHVFGIEIDFVSSDSSNCVGFCLRFMGFDPNQASYLAPKDLEYLD